MLLETALKTRFGDRLASGTRSLGSDPPSRDSLSQAGKKRIRALATEGIQHGHMSLHARQMATAAGATGDMVARVVETMIAEGNIRLERAKEIVALLRASER